MAVNINDVVKFIAESANDDDLDRIFHFFKKRRKALAVAASASVVLGSEVSLLGLTPRVLDGLTGTVVSLHGNFCDVLLDVPSTGSLAASKTKLAAAARAAEGSGYLLRGVPVSCARVAE